MTKKQITAEILNVENALKYSLMCKEIYGYQNTSIEGLSDHLQQLKKEAIEVKEFVNGMGDIILNEVEKALENEN